MNHPINFNPIVIACFILGGTSLHGHQHSYHTQQEPGSGYHGSGDGGFGLDFLIDDIECLGNESSIFNCSRWHGEHDCNVDAETAGIRCTPGSMHWSFMSNYL